MDQQEPIGRRDMLFLGVAGTAGVLLRQVPHSFGLRQRVFPHFNGLAHRGHSYTAYELDEEEFIGRAPRFDPSDLGYERNHLAAVKYHPKTGATDDGSWRRVDPDHPRWQWHVHVWWDSDMGEVFSHYEYRPDLRRIGDESVWDLHQRLRDHHTPTWDRPDEQGTPNYFRGAACERILATLETG